VRLVAGEVRFYQPARLFAETEGSLQPILPDFVSVMVADILMVKTVGFPARNGL
jgi:hypothetical protein